LALNLFVQVLTPGIAEVATTVKAITTNDTAVSLGITGLVLLKLEIQPQSQLAGAISAAVRRLS